MIKSSNENLRTYPQTVEFNGHDELNSVELYSKNVTIVASPNGIDHGSSKVKLKNIVDFSWDSQYYAGQLLAVHMSGKYLAYGITLQGDGVVRVVYKDSQQRALLRGMHGNIQDLAFAHVTNVVLACVDQTGSVFVHTIVSTTTQLVCNLLLCIDADGVSPPTHRVIWCPYIPEDDTSESDDVSKLLIVTRGPKAELWHVDNVYTQFGPGPLKLQDPTVAKCGGFTEICQHGDTIVEAILSPDGTAIATASLDGEVKFFQVNIHGTTLEKPVCLHQWRPHEGRPISSLFFLDDHKNTQPDVQFWRFAITGCNNNSELTIWSCEKWACLQTIKFEVSPSNAKTPVLKAGLDLAAGYLLLSDICNKALYILSLSKNVRDSVACVSTISEFRLSYPILSFGIVDAGVRKVRPTAESLEDLCPCDDENEDQLVIRMYLVQPKSLQECHIAFQPARQVINSTLMDTLTHDSLIYSDDIQHIRHEQNGINESRISNESVAQTIEAAINSANLNLMTPDAFSSPAKKENASTSSSPELGNVLAASPSLAQVVQVLNTTDTPLATSETEHAQASGGSSPSREVREIFSLAEPEDDDEEEDDMKQIDSDNENNKNWSYHPLSLLSDVQIMPEEPKKEIKTESVIEKQPDPAWLSTETAITGLTSKLDGLVQIIQDQRTELRELRTEVTRLRQETPISTRVESALARATQQQLAVIEQSMYSRISRQNEFLSAVDSTCTENIKSSLPKIANEIIEPFKNQAKLDAKIIEESLRENLTKIITGAPMKDIIALAVVNAAKPALDTSFKETFSSILLPGIEKACQSMFRQIQDAFTNGTQEYIRYIDTVLEKSCQQRNEQQAEALSYIVRDELRTEMVKSFVPLQEGLLRVIRESVRDNLGQQFIDIQARSRATTPGISVPNTAEAQVRILSLLQRGQYNAAFQQALSASDLGLVVFVCEKTEPSRVFLSDNAQGNRSSYLQQPVILSLVQQLSADLGHRTDLKQKWLQEAILNLDIMDPVTCEHIGNVLITLETQLLAFITRNPSHPTVKNLKMLSMAAKALLHSRLT